MPKPGAKRRPKSKRGRPSFEPTPAQRKMVSVAAGAGCTQDAIAVAIGITKPTLMKHFAAELTTVAHVRRFEVIQGLYEAALAGSAAAAKAYLAAGVKPTDAKPTPDEPEVAMPEGKKAQAEANAKVNHKGTSWEQLLESPQTVQ
jgi:hypothetical protein